jgi:pimeloyl-ACP methyl ester carboxylesterase
MLTGHRRVILPDLLGFGEASQPADFDYRLSNLAEILGDFLEGIGLHRYDLGGNSLGGAVSATLALQRPDAVRSLMLVASAGVRMPRPSPLQLQLDAGENPFVMSTFEEYQAWVRVVLELPPSIPIAVQRYLADDFIGRAPLNAKIMDQLLGSDEDLTERLPEIEAPTLLLWGDRDRLIDVSAGRVFHRELPDARMVILHGVGHCPQLETPRKTARVFREFLASVERR